MNPTAASIAGIICEKYDVLCEADGFSLHSANLYLEGISFISITYAVPVPWTSKFFFPQFDLFFSVLLYMGSSFSMV
jgi:hypothetical protein